MPIRRANGILKRNTLQVIVQPVAINININIKSNSDIPLNTKN